MGHVITAYVAKISTLTQIAAEYRSAVVIPLGQEFGLLPITDAFRREAHAPGGEPIVDIVWTDENILLQFHDITDKLAEIGVAASSMGAVAYIENEYFGGDGVQGAVVWLNGETVLGPLISARMGPISRALSEIGVQKGTALDEFDALGLGKYRSTDDWLKEVKD